MKLYTQEQVKKVIDATLEYHQWDVQPYLPAMKDTFMQYVEALGEHL